jgi:hypothetical protein
VETANERWNSGASDDVFCVARFETVQYQGVKSRRRARSLTDIVYEAVRLQRKFGSQKKLDQGNLQNFLEIKYKLLIEQVANGVASLEN